MYKEIGEVIEKKENHPVESNEVVKENKNSHYQGTIETIEYMNSCMTPEAFEGFLIGNILKYTSRLGKKGQDETDKKKILDYSHYLAKGCWYK